MPKVLISCCMLLAALLADTTAMAAKFEVKDVSGQQSCLPAAFPLVDFPLATRCYPLPAGTVEVVITPEPGELPIKCYDNFRGGEFCTYAADFYVVARHDGQWLTRNTYAWEPVDIAQLPATTQWPPWGGTTSMGYVVYASGIHWDDCCKMIPPPEDFEVWVGLTPIGSPSFAPELVHKVYPPPAP